MQCASQKKRDLPKMKSSPAAKNATYIKLPDEHLTISVPQKPPADGSELYKRLRRTNSEALILPKCPVMSTMSVRSACLGSINRRILLWKSGLSLI